MRKSLPLLSTLILTAGGLGLMNTSSVSAIVETPEGETLYTLEDVIAMNTEMNALIAENCGTDLMNCGRNFFDSQTYTTPKYKALDYYLNSNILITSITPSAGRLKIFYNNIDGMMRWYGPLNRELISLHMGWSELSPEDTSATFVYAPSLSDLETVPDWYHFIYSSTPGANDSTIIPQAETEIQSITGNMNGLATGGGIQFTTQEINGGLSSGWFFVDSCFDSPYYKDGMECRLTFTDNYRTKFIPYKNGVPAWLAPDDSVGDTTMDGTATENNSTNSSPIAYRPESNSNDTQIIYVTTTSSTSDVSASPSTSASTTPNYVAYTTDSTTTPANTDEKEIKNDSTSSDLEKEKSQSPKSNFSVPLSGEGQTTTCATDFPWWFILLVLGIDAVIMFIIWPKSHQQKSVD